MPNASTTPKHGRRCHAKARRTGKRCKKPAIHGGTVCPSHGGSLKRVKAKAAVRFELERWKLGDTTVDPGEVLLRLVTQSAARCELYAQLLGEAYDAAARLAELDGAEQDRLSAPMAASGSAAREAAQQDLERVFSTGGVGALIGYTFSGVKDLGVFPTGEAIRGLAKLEADERDRCANFAAKAVSAGLAERQVRIAEQQAALLARAVRGIAKRVGIDLSDHKVIEVVAEEVRALGQGQVA